MHGISYRQHVVRGALGCALAFAALGPACADSDNVSPAGAAKRWTRIELAGYYAFRGDVLEDEDLSGIACVSRTHCLVGADEGRQVQVVALARETRTLTVKGTVSLLDSGQEIDIEAIAAEGNSYFIVGSHGVAKKTGQHQENRFRIFRLKVDPATGAMGPPEVASLSPLLRGDRVLGRYFQKPLQQRGVNIEGLAVRDGRLFVGLRNPNLGGRAYIVEVRAADVFAGRPQPDYTLHELALGSGLGIREIVAARSGFLIIAGNAGSEPSEKYTRAENYDAGRGFVMFTWDGKGPQVHEVGTIPKVPGKAEAMTILDETPDQVTVLILFDGPQGGRPSVYRIY